jgi:hypothetical protein
LLSWIFSGLAHVRNSFAGFPLLKMAMFPSKSSMAIGFFPDLLHSEKNTRIGGKQYEGIHGEIPIKSVWKFGKQERFLVLFSVSYCLCPFFSPNP